jgi:3-hydroxyacyl-CoA dehydrogenase
VLGLLFFGTVPLLGLVEVVKVRQTSLEVSQRRVEFIRRLGKTSVKEVQEAKDIPPFVVNASPGLFFARPLIWGPREWSSCRTSTWA